MGDAFDPDYAPYGTYEGPPGCSDEWAASFGEAWSQSTAQQAIGDQDPWAVLGLEPGASQATLKKAYRRLMLENHPDLAADDMKAEATERSKQIIAAYSLLADRK